METIQLRNMITNVLNIYISCHSKPYLLDKPKMLFCARARRTMKDLLGVHSFLMYPWFDEHTSVNTVLILSRSLSSSNQSPNNFEKISVKRVCNNFTFISYLVFIFIQYSLRISYLTLFEIYWMSQHMWYVPTRTHYTHPRQRHTHTLESYNGRNRQNINHIKPIATS